MVCKMKRIEIIKIETIMNVNEVVKDGI